MRWVGNNYLEDFIPQVDALVAESKKSVEKLKREFMQLIKEFDIADDR
jgi:hypothetical protein